MQLEPGMGFQRLQPGPHGGQVEISGQGQRTDSGTVHRSCNEPAESIPMKSRCRQMCWFPAKQAAQVPSRRNGITVTGSATAQPVTPSPRAVMRHDIS